MKVISSCNNNYNQSFFQTKANGDRNQTHLVVCFQEVQIPDITNKRYRAMLFEVCQQKSKKVRLVPFLKSPSRNA